MATYILEMCVLELTLEEDRSVFGAHESLFTLIVIELIVAQSKKVDAVFCHSTLLIKIYNYCSIVQSYCSWGLGVLGVLGVFEF